MPQTQLSNLNIAESATSHNKYATLPNLDNLPDYGIETKKNKMGLLFLGLLLLIIVAAFSWTIFTSIQESVNGTGQIVPEGKLRQIMPPVSGIVSEVFVTENQHVKAGDLLVTLEPNAIEIEKMAVADQLALMHSEISALHSALGDKNASVTGFSKGWIGASQENFQSQLDEVNKQIEAARHAYQQSVSVKNSATALLKSKQQQLKKYEALYSEGGLSDKDVETYRQEVMGQEGLVGSLNEQVQTKKADLETALLRPKTLKSKYQTELMNISADKQERLLLLNGRAAQTQLILKRHEVRAPVDGIVNELVIHGKGETVNINAGMMNIIPDNMPLYAEVKIPNRDMSYIKIGQSVTLKVDALPYQRFGKLYGKVKAISPFTRQDKLGNIFFLVTITPDKTILEDEWHQKYPLRPGMTVSAEIRTRQKSIITFFTEPMHERLENAFHDPSTR